MSNLNKKQQKILLIINVYSKFINLQLIYFSKWIWPLSKVMVPSKVISPQLRKTIVLMKEHIRAVLYLAENKCAFSCKSFVHPAFFESCIILRGETNKTKAFTQQKYKAMNLFFLPDNRIPSEDEYTHTTMCKCKGSHNFDKKMFLMIVIMNRMA